MHRALLISYLVLALAPLPAAAATPPKLTAAEIVENNVAARGGLASWRKVSTLSWSGKLDAGGGNRPPILGIPGQQRPAQTTPEQPAPQMQLPFVLEMKRGHKSRLEIVFKGETAIQVYDGSHGWKLRPFLNRHEVEDFTADELKVVENQADLDGQLVDYAAKGTRVELEGIEKVEGNDAYKLKLTLKNGHVMHEWVDAKSFLEVRIEGAPRRLDKKDHPVSIYLSDYRKVNGLLIPHLIETRVDGVKQTEKILIEKVVVNPRLDESRFGKPT